MSGDRAVLALEEILPDMSSLADLEPLVRAVHQADVDAGILTDEEVHWIGPDTRAPPSGFIDAPRLAQLSPREQDIALETALLILEARGDVIYNHREDIRRLVGGHALLSELRNAPEAAVSVRVDVRGEGTRRAAVYRVRPDLFLIEEVHESGLHHFVFRGAEPAASWLAAMVDPNGRADRTGPYQSAATLDGFDPHPNHLAATCEASALTYYGSRNLERQAAQRSFRCYSGPDGLHALAGWQTPTGKQVVLQRLGPYDLLGFCDAFLSGSAETGSSASQTEP